ncbi:type II/IV secretion system protein [Candidatus Gracilibacteria bacterium]|nr:type II/IV secretion system protein [Candidatus Gracilibacteria bacterium]NUJ98996.1 type II/IV secretion system protein [Candidatus Gracilibacteria bacterium]
MQQKTKKTSQQSKKNINTEELKNTILSQEEKKQYYSSKFEKIEARVKENLKNQNTDEALKDITIGAMVVGSSDIHYELFEKDVRVRFRIDGILVDIFDLTQKEYKGILERLKYSAGLKLNILDIPQDGKYNVKIDEEKKVDIRVSTLPTKYGENTVCRILDSGKTIIDFSDLGFFWTSERMIQKIIHKKTGLVLVTGPTGSGKTTTLYTMLSKLNTRDKKIITLEDPIEYELPGIIQSEVKEKNGFSFETGLKAILRQDPDIIMVGEIRDFETLMTATNASLTGHLVLSTLHTKSAAETLDRILSMGLKPYLMAAALDTIIAQRLVRRICPHCKKEKEKTIEEVAIISGMMEEIGMKSLGTDNIKLYEGIGCEHCNNSGYLGRVGLYEIISLNENIRNIMRSGGTSEDIIREARNGDLITMKEDGILKAIQGHTTIEEILRVI